jgi:ATP-dependent Zn protease
MSEIIAYHEAGHAWTALLHGGEVRCVTIEPDRDDGPRRDGDTQVLWRRSKMSEKEFARIRVQVSLAGPVAEMIYTGEPYHPGLVAEWAADWHEAWQAAALLHADERRLMRYLEDASIALYRRFEHDEHWSPLAALADHLLAHETLEAEQIEDIVSPWRS